MACTKTVTGSCTKVADAEGVVRKTPAVFPPLTTVLVTPTSSDFTMTWDGFTASMRLYVQLMTRPTLGGALLTRQIVDTKHGTLTTPYGLNAGAWYEIWFRVQSATQYDEWTRTVTKTLLA